MDKAQKVSYSASELAVKRMLSGNMKYADLATSGVTKRQFLENLPTLKMEFPAFVRRAESGEIVILDGEYQKKEGDEFVWPEPQDSAFRKAAMQSWLSKVDMNRVNKDHLPMKNLMVSLFGENFYEEAVQYANIASDDELTELCEKVFEERFGAVDLNSSRFSERDFVYYVKETCRKKNIHNVSGAITIATQIVAGKRAEMARKAEDARREAAREADEALRANPNFKEVPQKWKELFEAMDIEICYNTQPYHNSFRGRKTSYEAFERLFIHDKAFGGPVYQNKEKLKEHGASWAKTWDERSGGWWHLPAEVELETLYAILS